MSNPFMDKYHQQVAGGSGSGNGRNYDLIAEITGFDVENGRMAVKLDENAKAVQDGYPQKFEVFISKYAPPTSRPDADFEGNVIDQRMAEAFDTGDTVVLERTTLNAGDGPFATNWISSAPGGNPAKLIEGNFTASGFKKENDFLVTHVQQWPQRAVAEADFFTDVNKAVFDRVVADHQKVVEARDSGGPMPPVKPAMGVSMRAIKDGEVVDFVPPVSYNPQANRPITFDEIQGGIEAYKEHVEQAYGEDARVEILPVREFRVAPKSQTAMKGPVTTMANTTGKLNPDADMPQFGNSVLGVHGVMALSPGKLDKKGQRVGAENQWAIQLYASGRKFPIQSAVADATGEPVQLNELIADFNYPTPSQAQQQAPSQGPDNAAGNTPEQPSAQETASPGKDEAPAEQAGGNADEEDMDDMLDDALAKRDQGTSPEPG